MAIGLRKAAPRLLRMVKGKPHATNDDHAEQLLTPPGTNSTRSSMATAKTTPNGDDEDLTRSPESSGDESVAITSQLSSFKTPRHLDEGAEEQTRRLPTFTRPKTFSDASSPGSAGSKRHISDSEGLKSYDNHGDDDDSMIFGPEHRKKQKSAATYVNIHAPRRKEKGYGSKRKQQPERSPQKSSGKKAVAFQRPSNVVDTEEEEVSKPKLPLFKKAVGVDTDMFEFGMDRSETHTMQGKDPLSPELSSLSSGPDSPDVQEIKRLNLPNVPPYRRCVECQICNEELDPALQEEFQILFTKGKHILDYKWQQRFCRWHRQRDAERRRVEHGYPDVDWEQLDRRMRNFHRHLKAVISGAKPSFYRQELNARVKDGSKTALGALTAEGNGKRREVSVGYYGPRGERVMYAFLFRVSKALLRLSRLLY